MSTSYSSIPKSIICAAILITASSVSIAQEAKNEQEETKSSLELPDVIVYGVDTGLRQAGKKTAAAHFSIPAVSSDALNPYPSLPLSQGELSSPSMQQSIPGHNTVLSSYFGPYSSWGLQAIHNQTLKKVHLRLFSDLQGTNGEYDNSGGTWGEIEGRVRGPLSNTITGGFQAGYRRWSYGLYGSNDPWNDRLQEKLIMQTHLDHYQSQGPSCRLQFAFQRFMLSLKNDELDLYERTENLLQGNLSFHDTSGPHQVSSEIHWTGNHPSGSGSADNLLTFNLKGRVLLLPKSSLEVGGLVQWYTSGGDDRKRIFPEAKLLLRPIAPVAIHGSVGGGYRYYSSAELFEINPYNDSYPSPLLEEGRLHIEATSEVEIMPCFIVRGTYRWSQFRDYLYWNFYGETGLFNPEQLYDVRRQQIDLSLIYDLPSDPLKFEIGFSSLHHEIEGIRGWKDRRSSEVPFCPKYRGRGVVSFEAPHEFIFRSDWQWVGSRPVTIGGKLELDSYLLINFGLEKKVRRNITLLANIYNLTDSDYEVWYNYPEMGINIHGGVKIVF